MSPVLFCIYMNDAIKAWQREITSGIEINNRVINTILFADDQAVFGTSEDDLQRAAYKLNKAMAEYNLQISTTKSKVIAFKGKAPLRCKIVIDNQIIEQVTGFNYLGFHISYSSNEDINNKLNKFRSMCGTIRRHLGQKTLRSTQLKFYKVMAVPMLRYGCENWATNRGDKRKIETAEMKFLRAVAGVSLFDHVKNEEIRRTLNIPSVNDLVESQKKNWHQHILRMDDKRLPKTAMEYIPKGRRDVGRPMTRWQDEFS